MNPLSFHPPRTPRPSLVGQADMYTNHFSQISEKSPFEPPEPSLKEDLASDAGLKPTRVRSSDAWRDMIATSNGRDKALKLIQYSLKFYLLLHHTLAGDLRRRIQPRVPRAWEVALLARLTPTVAGLSLARKCLLLFNWLEPLNNITREEDSISYTTQTSSPLKGAPQPLLYPFLQAPPPVLLDLVNGIAEDISTSAKLGLIKGRLGRTAGRLADWTWLGGTLVSLIELSMKRAIIRNSTRQVSNRLYKQTMEHPGEASDDPGRGEDEHALQQLSEQLYWLRATRAKLWMDLVFVTYSCFNIERGREVVQTIAGLISACLSSAKLYDHHRQRLIKNGLS